MRLLLGVLTASALAVLLLYGCGSAPAPANKLPAEVRLGYFANLTHAQALIGVARGDFQQALGAVPLKTLTFNAGPSVVEAFFAGELDIAYVGPSPAINAYVKSRGTAVRLVAGAASNGVVIVASSASGIAKLDDLRGKRIATPQFGNTQDVSARIYVKQTLKEKLKADGGSTEIECVANADQIGLFKQGQLDASWVPEPWGARLIHEAGAKLIAEEKDLWPEHRFSTAVVLVSAKFLEQYPDTVESLLRVHVRLTDWINSHRAEAATAANEQIKKLTGKALSQAVLDDAFSRIEFSTDPGAASVQTFAQWAFDLGLTQEKPELKDLVDLRCLEKARAAVKADLTNNR